MMDSGLIGKIEKAKRYAEEKDRISISKFEAKFRGEKKEVKKKKRKYTN